MKELVDAYDEYIALLVRAESGLFGLAYAHGFSIPESFVKRGEELRAKIAELRSQIK